MVKILEKIRKFSKEESGASMVMVVLSLVVIFGFTAFAVDFGNAYTTKVSMQDACDLSALAAADSLPEIAKTESVAKEYAELNGYDPENVTVNILNNGEQVEVKIKKDVKTYFAGVVGYSELPVSCKAVAAAGKSAKDYAIFSGTTTNGFGLHGNINIPEGDVHTNSRADLDGTLNINNGVIEIPEFNNKGASGNYEVYKDEKNYIEMPYYDDIINARIPYVEGYNSVDDFGEYVKSHTHDGVFIIESDEKIHLDDLNMRGYSDVHEVVIKGAVETKRLNMGIKLTVEGKLSFYDAGGTAEMPETEISGVVTAEGGLNFNNKVILNGATIVANKNIAFQCESVEDKCEDGEYSAIWSKESNININSKINIKSLLYSPKGEFIMYGGDTNIVGSIVGYQIGTHNGNLTVRLPKDDSNWPFAGKTKAGKNKKGAKLVE